MLYRLFKYILPILALFSLFIYLGGNLDLFDGFTYRSLSLLSNLEFKNPANDIYPLFQELDRLRVLTVNVAQGNDFLTQLSAIYQLGFSGITVGFSLLRCLALLFYDLAFNIIQALRYIMALTGIGVSNPDSIDLMVPRI